MEVPVPSPEYSMLTIGGSVDQTPSLSLEISTKTKRIIFLIDKSVQTSREHKGKYMPIIIPTCNVF